MASHAQDDGFHEIQLNGKQLVFVFMAATVVSVVIFLCGVLVGRGVRSERGNSIVEAARPTADAPEPSRPTLVTPERPPTVIPAGNDPTKAPPPAPPSADRESGAATPRGTASDPVAKTANAPAKAAKTEAPKIDAPKPDTRKPEAPKAQTADAEPSRAAESSASRPVDDVGSVPAKPVPGIPAADDRQGWMVQVAATKTRGEADTMAKRLSSKGYSAFVLTTSPNVFRVRVGGYKSRGDAETVAAKLQKEERINPWVTR